MFLIKFFEILAKFVGKLKAGKMQVDIIDFVMLYRYSRHSCLSSCQQSSELIGSLGRRA